MHLFANYIQPLTFWLYAHPHWALFITFLISFGESLAIIGSIIPGSVTMTAIGILAGSGVMRIDLTFFSAVLGAIAGDGGSYALGYTFSDRLSGIWPFKNYPGWLTYGQDYFSKHGASSVLIGRFVGPMRSIIPVIAGMMHMNHWHFFLANTISAIGWSILYVGPGVLIGAASNELSTESATRLFILILLLLAVVWLATLAIKWLLAHANQFLRTTLHDVWVRLKNNPRLMHFTKKLAPKDETQHYHTAALCLSFIVCFFISITTITLVQQGTWITQINTPTTLFFQSLRTQTFDSFFSTMSLLTSPLPLLTMIVSLSLIASYYKEWRLLCYWISLMLSTWLIILLLTQFIIVPNPIGLTKYHTLPRCPDPYLTLATSLFGFLILYISTHYNTVVMAILRILLLTTLYLAGIAIIYLGDNWFASVIASYFIGFTLCLIHWIFYRQSGPSHNIPPIAILLFSLVLASSSYVSYSLYFKQVIHSHKNYLPQYVITNHVWWSQEKPLLPIYSTNRFGKRTSLLNIQYAGSLKKLKDALESAGWKEQSTSFFYSLILRAGGQNATELPLRAQLYQNKKPSLMMTYRATNKDNVLILRLWRSNYHLRHYTQPIWLGNVDHILPPQAIRLNQLDQPAITAHRDMMRALPGFKFNQIPMPNHYLKSLPHPASPILLLIKAQ